MKLGETKIIAASIIPVKFVGSPLAEWEHYVYTAFLNFLCPELQISPTKITVMVLVSDQAKNKTGFIGADSVKGGNVKIRITAGILEYTYKHITHEMLHIKQVMKNELSWDKVNFYWNDKPVISINDYNNLGNKPDLYKHLPWEKEAYDMQDSFTSAFKSSDEFFNLTKVKGKPKESLGPTPKFTVEDTLKQLVRDSYKGSKQIE
jgi:hypothetical protein